MSKWVEIRDGIEDAVGGVQVTEQIKKNVLDKAYNEGLPAFEDVVNGFAAACRKQAESETGWIKVRDAYLIPICAQVMTFAAEYALKRVIEETAANA